MDIIKTPILEGITPEEQEQMRVCFGVREEAFRAGETIYDFSEGRKYLGLIAHGSAVLQRIDRQGGRAILEHLESGGVFGEMLMFENVAGDSITVIAEEPCRVWFMQDEHMTRRCERACAHHSRLVENMFHIMTEKAAALSERVEVLSRRSIREKLLWNLEKEIPHGTAVEITKFSERDDGIIDLDATIYCEKASHKGIIIGKNGQMLKKISSDARKDCERFMGTKVFLQTWVRVKENWRDSDFMISNFGYHKD